MDVGDAPPVASPADDHADAPGDSVDASAWRRRIAAGSARARRTIDGGSKRFEALRGRSPVVDTATNIYERDREAAGTLLGSALALRLFLFFVPFVLFAIGVLGVIGRYTSIDSLSSSAGITGELADQIDDTLDQTSGAPWLALGTGLLGIITTGRSLTRALVLSSALSWRLGGKQKLRVRVVGHVVGLIVAVTLLSAVLNRIRAATGVAVASASFLLVMLAYVVMWGLLFLSLPRATTDPGAALPGAALVAVALTAMQALSIMFLPDRIDRASTTYGAIGAAIAILGWFFILGRVIAFSFSVNAVMFERVGSLSKVVFALPLVRAVPRRYPAVGRYFDLDAHHASTDEGEAPEAATGP